jgi:hypothetical protein
MTGADFPDRNRAVAERLFDRHRTVLRQQAGAVHEIRSGEIRRRMAGGEARAHRVFAIELPRQAKAADAQHRGFPAEQMAVEFRVHRRPGKGRRADRHERACHATVRMGVDHPGHHDLPGSIDAIVVLRTEARPDIDDAAVADLDITAGNDAGAISAHNGSA